MNDNTDYVNGAYFHLKNIADGQRKKSWTMSITIWTISIIIPFSMVFTGNYFLTPEKCTIANFGCKKELEINFFNTAAYLFLVYATVVALISTGLTYDAFYNTITSEELKNSLDKVIADLEEVDYIEPAIYSVFVDQMTIMINEIKIPNDNYFMAIHNQKQRIGDLVSQVSFLSSSENS